MHIQVGFPSHRAFQATTYELFAFLPWSGYAGYDQRKDRDGFEGAGNRDIMGPMGLATWLLS